MKFYTYDRIKPIQNFNQKKYSTINYRPVNAQKSYELVYKCFVFTQNNVTNKI